MSEMQREEKQLEPGHVWNGNSSLPFDEWYYGKYCEEPSRENIRGRIRVIKRREKPREDS